MASTTASDTNVGATAPGDSGSAFSRQLIISELSAKFEKDKDLIGSQDPYFNLTLSGDSVTTRVIKSGGLNPVWDAEEGYRLHDRGEHPELVVQAWNKNALLKDSSLGEGKIAMQDLGAGNTHTVPLFDKKGNRTGELIFKAKEEPGATGTPSYGGADTAQTAAAAGAAGAAGATAADAGRHRDESDPAYAKEPKKEKVKEYAAADGSDRAYAKEPKKEKHHTDKEKVKEYAAADSGRTGELRKDEQPADTYAASQRQGVGNTYGADQQQQGYGADTGRTGELRSEDQGLRGAEYAAAGAAAGVAAGAGARRGGNDGTADNQYSTQTGGGGSDTATTALAGGATKTTTSSKRETEDTDVNETVVHQKRQGDIAAGAAIPDLEGSDDHWQRSLEAAAEARRQAKIVEQNSQVTHEKLLAAQEATRAFEKARREHASVQERIAALDLEAKRSKFQEATDAYEAAKGRLRGKSAEVDAAQQEANALRAVVNEKGEALDAEVTETKLHQSRLAELDERLGDLRSDHESAKAAHAAVLADLDPKRQRHASLQDEYRRVQLELEEHRGRRAQLEAQERELGANLDTHHREFETTGADLTEFDEIGRKKAALAEARRNDLSALEPEVGQVQAALADHRARIGQLKQDTEASLAKADEVAAAAQAKERQLAAAQKNIGQHEKDAGEAQAALAAAQASAQPLHEKVRKEHNTLDRQQEVVEELHRKLGMAKEEVDLAQAKKEELWEKAKWHGEQADKAADKHFLFAHQASQAVGGGSAYDPNAMTTSGATTQNILQKVGAKIGL